MRWRLQPYAMEAATVCDGGCNRMRWRLQPYGRTSFSARLAEGAGRCRGAGGGSASSTDAAARLPGQAWA